MLRSPTPPATRDLGQEAYARMRDQIRDGSLAPGIRLTETDLAARLGVSRTPIRQAIARLEAEGLVTHEPRRGLTVTRPDHQQVVELYVMREVLEGAAARLAAQHASETEIAAMTELVAKEPQYFTDARALAETNQRLHGLLYLAAHNRYLLRSLEQLSATMALLPSLLTQGGRAEQAHDEHRTILKALRRRDGDAAESAARAHAVAAQRHRLAWMVRTIGVPMATPGG
ncbi:GntR family transcriptional regulator [Plastoroseomonas hellenica]|uniref:GntR family transcriptional regulator n=1 Tax=Plastoroseomonas hellenica TaxID=2687306 RepID=A0ABS5EYJ6_9PROT|nr:GntR family transcriptional regulator [Plastoroseomonas hellenica]MBR0644548.1 GntR family transcriptional regulator [Plastoroseomonas hellenica]MBR0665356.1 GntR family transcriptional regulator [Plastoroseomonas hellenica]